MGTESADPSCPRYRAYVLRMWLEQPRGAEGEQNWRFQVQEPGTEEVQLFNSKDALVSFFERQMTEIKP